MWRKKVPTNSKVSDIEYNYSVVTKGSLPPSPLAPIYGNRDSALFSIDVIPEGHSVGVNCGLVGARGLILGTKTLNIYSFHLIQVVS